MPAIAYLLSQAAHHTPSADNSQPWQFSWQEDTLTVGYDSERVANKTFTADSHATLLTIGALSENLIQAAEALHINLDWTYPSLLNKDHPVYFETTITKSDNAPAIAFNELPLFKRHTNRYPYKNKPLGSDCGKLLQTFTAGNARIILIEEQSLIHKIAGLVRSASEIRFQTQEIHEWLAKSLRFDTKSTDQYGEGLDVATIDLPPGGNLFLRLISNWRRMSWLNKWGIYKALALIDSLPVKKAPALIAIVGPDQFHNTLAAGQLMNRAWIALNEQGIAMHPYYVVSDQMQRRQLNSVPAHLIEKADSLIQQTKQLLQLENQETLHMLFRVGYPTKSPVKSKRLPLEIVCSGNELNSN